MPCFTSGCSLFVFSYIFLSFPSCAPETGVNKLSALTKELLSMSLIADRIDKLEKLAYVDLQLFKSLTAIRENLDPKNITALRLDRYINDFQEGKGRATGWSKKDARKIAENPISAFRLIRRYVDDLQSDLSINLKKLDGIPKEAILPRSKYPVEADFHIVAAGILMIQDFYNLSASDLSEGRVNGIETGARLNAVHCFHIGRIAKNSRYYVQAIDWLLLALQKSKKSDRTHNYDLITTELQLAEEEHDAEIKKPSSNHYLYLFTEPIKEYLGKLLEWQQVKGQTLPRPTKPRTRHDVLFEEFHPNLTPNSSNLADFNFELRLRAVCKGHNFQTEEAKSRLFCWYEHRKHPRLLIGPLKMEFLAHAPDIVQVYEAIGPQTIKKVLALSRVQKFMKKDFESIDAGAAYWEKGFGVFTIVWDGVPQNHGEGQGQGQKVGDAFIVNEETLLSIPRIVEAASGLEAAKNENCSGGLFIKPYNFGVTGFPHFDSPKIATAVFYFTNTEGGGYTAFPRVGMAVRPIKGSFVFWFNELRSRKSDKMLKHSPCPVYMGKKIIASKWILAEGQFQSVQCSRQERERFKILVNEKL